MDSSTFPACFCDGQGHFCQITIQFVHAYIVMMAEFDRLSSIQKLVMSNSVIK